MIVSSMRYRAISLAQITRFTNSIYAAIYTLIGAYLAVGVGGIGLKSIGAAIVVALIVAYGFVINDYVDVVVDGYSKPNRPIPAGRIGRTDALYLAIGLVASALLLAFWLGPTLGLVALSTALLATIYSFALKSTVLWGNACMGLLIGSIPFYGALSVGRLPLVVWIVSGLMWLFDLSHEILKTTADWEGDAKAQLSTVATAFGVTTAVRIFQVVAFLFMIVALLPWLLGLAPLIYALVLLPCAILPTSLVIGLLARRIDDATITISLKIMRYMWITNLLPIIVLGMAAA